MTFYTFGILINNEWYNYSNNVLAIAKENYDKCKERIKKEVIINYKDSNGFKKLIGIKDADIEAVEEKIMDSRIELSKTLNKETEDEKWGRINKERKISMLKFNSINNATRVFLKKVNELEDNKDIAKKIYDLADELNKEGLSRGYAE